MENEPLSPEAAKIVRLLSKRNARITFRDLADQLGVSKTKLTKSIAEIRTQRKDLVFAKFDRSYYFLDQPNHYSKATTLDLPLEGRLGVISDTHLCSDAERLDVLEEAYDAFQDQGITTVLHAGDLTDGWRQYRSHAQFVRTTGEQKQALYTINNYPHRRNIKTYVIGGNHDTESWEHSKVDRISLITEGFVDQGITKIEGRDDIIYLGQYSHTLILPQEVTIHLLHPKGSHCYARSYKQQKRSESMDRETRPDIQISGHFHTQNYAIIQGTHFIACPGMQDETELTKRLGLERSIGFTTLDYDIRKGKINVGIKFKLL